MRTHCKNALSQIVLVAMLCVSGHYFYYPSAINLKIKDVSTKSGKDDADGKWHLEVNPIGKKIPPF